MHIAIVVLTLLTCATAAGGETGWQPGPTFADAAAGRLFGAGLRDGNRIYVIGGLPFVSPDDDARVDFIDHGDASWTRSAPVEGPIVRQGAGVDALGRVIVFGGREFSDPDGDEGRAYEYDIVEGQWHDVTDRTSAAPPMHFAWATDDAQRIYSIGGGPGEDADAGDPNLAHAERYDALTDSWQVIAPLPVAVADAAAVNDGTGRILVIGGVDALATTRLDIVQSLDVATGQWSTVAVPSLPAAISDHRATLGADGRVYVAGGVSGPIGAGTTLASTWVLDLPTSTWSPGPDMATARSCFAMTLGPDDHVWAMGGCSQSGGTDLVERLYTPTCPTFIRGPGAAVDRWTRQTLVLPATVVGGTPMTYVWSKDGVELVDGPSAGGGTISGATTDTLMITDVEPIDSGSYTLAATNPCGTTVGAPTFVTVTSPAPIPATWAVVEMHPSWSLTSVLNAVDDDVQLGTGSVYVEDYGNIARPTMWSGTPASAIDLTPSNSVGGSLLAGDGNVQVGWWWWPYQCQIGGEWYTCYHRHGASWAGTPESHENVHPSGIEYSLVADTDGTTHVGTVSWDDEVGNHYSRAALFPPPNHNYQSLHPTGYSNSGLAAIDGSRQFGSANTPYPGPTTHAGMWSGSADSFVDLHPAGANRSWISHAADGQQVGSADLGDGLISGTWDGEPGTFHAFPSGNLSACGHGYQVGATYVDGVYGAAIWIGADDTMVHLHAFAPERFSTSGANDVHVKPDGTIVIGGYGYDPALERTEALLWRSLDNAPGDINGDGFVDVTDMLILLGEWGPCDTSCPADLDGSGTVDVSDLLILLGAWS